MSTHDNRDKTGQQGRAAPDSLQDALNKRRAEINRLLGLLELLQGDDVDVEVLAPGIRLVFKLHKAAAKNHRRRLGKGRVPALCCHKASGNAYVTDPATGKEYYLRGPSGKPAKFGTAEAEEAYRV